LSKAPPAAAALPVESGSLEDTDADDT